MYLVKVISTKIDQMNRRLVKFLLRGDKDIQESLQAAPHGIDSNPVKDMVAVYAETSKNGDTVLVGYLNKNQLAAIGETRIFSTNSSGQLSFYLWFRNNGTAEFGGTGDHLVRYRALETALNAELTKINQEYAKIAAAINAIIPGLYTFTPVTLNMSAARINEIKTTP